METAENEDRQRTKRCAIGACDHIGGRRQFADIELDLSHHTPKGGNLRYDANEFGLNPLDLDAAIQKIRCVRIFCNGERQMKLL